MQSRGRRCLVLWLTSALLGALFPVKHIGACNFMVPAAHQTQFYLVLYILNMESAAAGAGAHHGAHDRLGQLVYRLANAGRGSALRAVYSKKRFHHGNSYLIRSKRYDRTIAPDNLVAVDWV